MSPTTLAYSQTSTAQEEDRFVALIKQADALEIAVRRTERKLKDKATLRTGVSFAVVLSAFVVTFGLALSPYLDLSRPIPQIISYVAAFAVVVLAYLVHLAYANAAASRELVRARQFALEDGRSALTRAFATLDGARNEDPLPRETRARIDCAILDADAAQARLQKLETQTRQSLDDAITPPARPRSSVLAGIVGGFAGGAFGVSVASGGTMAVAGPVGAAIGVAVAVLLWRGPAHWRVERATDRTEEALALYYQELTRPGTGMPEPLRDNHWERYDRLLASYAALAERAVGGAYGIPGATTTQQRTADDEKPLETSPNQNEPNIEPSTITATSPMRGPTMPAMTMSP